MLGVSAHKKLLSFYLWMVLLLLGACLVLGYVMTLDLNQSNGGAAP